LDPKVRSNMIDYRLISSVLADMEAELRLKHGDSLDEQIKSHLHYLQSRYKTLHDSQQGPSYSDDITQFCYVYKYVCAHADYMYKLLRWARIEEKAPLFNKSSIKVACIGAGPGSDLLGVLKYLMASKGVEPVAHVEFDLFDKELKWIDTSNALVSKLNTGITGVSRYETFDVTDRTSWEKIDFSSFDLITSSFFVSETRRLNLGSSAKDLWNHVLESMSSDCLLAFNDNNDERVYLYFQKIIEDHASLFNMIVSEASTLVCSESYSPVASIIHRLDHRPKKNSDSAYRVLRKA
jgi:hypothetical protein